MDDIEIFAKNDPPKKNNNNKPSYVFTQLLYTSNIWYKIIFFLIWQVAILRLKSSVYPTIYP